MPRFNISYNEHSVFPWSVVKGTREIASTSTLWGAKLKLKKYERNYKKLAKYKKQHNATD